MGEKEILSEILSKIRRGHSVPDYLALVANEKKPENTEVNLRIIARIKEINPDAAGVIERLIENGLLDLDFMTGKHERGLGWDYEASDGTVIRFRQGNEYLSGGHEFDEVTIRSNRLDEFAESYGQMHAAQKATDEGLVRFYIVSNDGTRIWHSWEWNPYVHVKSKQRFV